MPNSLKVKFKSLRYRCLIDDAEYRSMCKKLDGHDSEIKGQTIRDVLETVKEQNDIYLAEREKQIRAEVIDDAIHSLDNSKAICHEDYVDGIDFAIGVLGNIAEQMQKEVENE